MLFLFARYALALALVLLVITPLLSGCGGGSDEAEDCPAHAAPAEGMKTIPAEPCQSTSH